MSVLHRGCGCADILPPLSLYERGENLDTYQLDATIKLLTLLLMHAKICKLSHPKLIFSSLVMALCIHSVMECNKYIHSSTILSYFFHFLLYTSIPPHFEGKYCAV